ncbi:MAG: hypothetical protein QF864_09275 [SAR202 cluster bacterium]|jgi:hypothetical protein|nr:hypothetical protein [SAR202 cluster bacterium]
MDKLLLNAIAMMFKILRIPGKEYLINQIYQKIHPIISPLLENKGMKLKEAITIDVKIGDTILTGKFKNKKTVIKSITKDEHGMPVINDRKATTFRIFKEK